MQSSELSCPTVLKSKKFPFTVSKWIIWYFIDKELCLFDKANSIGPDGVTELARLIENSTSLTRIDIKCKYENIFYFYLNSFSSKRNWTWGCKGSWKVIKEQQITRVSQHIKYLHSCLCWFYLSLMRQSNWGRWHKWACWVLEVKWNSEKFLFRR